MIYSKSKSRLKMATGGTPDLTKQTDLVGEVADRAQGTLPTGTTITADKVATAAAADPKTEVTYTPLTAAPTVTADKAAVTPSVATPTTPAAGAYDYTAATTVGATPTATAADLTAAEISPEVKVGNIQGTLSADAEAVAAQTTVDQKQLVSYQLGQLMNSIQAGKPLPAWAAGASRAATAIMQKRGLGSSSMAAAAQIQSLVEAGTPIAAADAAEYSKINIANLNNRQQAVLQNAATVAQMDMANLDARMKASVTNAQNFLSIDLANLNNEQATETLNYQGKLQALFTDAAAENAQMQFNAKNQAQVDQFFAELGVQVDNANANRVAAMEQFNVDQANSIKTFNASMEDSRDRFDATMRTQIDQSNASWRREIATIDTAAQNEVNRQNAMNILQVSQSSLSALWQRYRDESAWLMQSTENAQQRAHQLALAEFQKNANIEMFDLEAEYETAASIGSAAMAGVLGFLK